MLKSDYGEKRSQIKVTTCKHHETLLARSNFNEVLANYYQYTSTKNLFTMYKDCINQQNNYTIAVVTI